MKKFNAYLKKTKIFFTKLYTRFVNYKNTKKWFVLYLAVLTFCLFLFPVISANGSSVRFLLSGMLWKSWLVMLLAIVGLLIGLVSFIYNMLYILKKEEEEKKKNDSFKGE